MSANKQPEPLFDVKATAPLKCRACGVTRKSLCDWAETFATTPFAERPRRPRGCLNSQLGYTGPIL